MNKCLRITLVMEPKGDFLKTVVQKCARKYDLEGFGQFITEEGVRIIVCGDKDKVDAFIDELHRETVKAKIKDIEIEPFLKDKDYRGVFRIIE